MPSTFTYVFAERQIPSTLTAEPDSVVNSEEPDQGPAPTALTARTRAKCFCPGSSPVRGRGLEPVCVSAGE